MRGVESGSRLRYFAAGRVTRAQPDDASSRVMSRWRRSTWRLSTGGCRQLWRRSPPRRSRITSRLSSAYTCLRYMYRFGSVRDTMKSKSATFPSARFQHPVHSRMEALATPGAARRDLGCAVSREKLCGQKTPRPERRKADRSTCERSETPAHAVVGVIA